VLLWGLALGILSDRLPGVAAGAFKQWARSAAPGVLIFIFPEKLRVLGLAVYPLSWGNTPTLFGRVVSSPLLL
jgi:hypothetical protein